MPRADGLHGSDGLPTSGFPHGGRLGLSPGSIEELTTFFSTPRLLRYYQSSGDSPDEMWALYKWNLEVSSAFQIPLHFCEIAIRNAVADTFCEVHGERWPWADSLLYSLDKNSKDKLIESRTKFNNQGTGKVVADLDFIFWEGVLSRRQRDFWAKRIRGAFPNLPEGNDDEFRRTIKDHVRHARQLRNRIAHHEPIFDRNLSQHLRRILTVVSWRSMAASELLRSMETVSELLSNRPNFKVPIAQL